MPDYIILGSNHKWFACYTWNQVIELAKEMFKNDLDETIYSCDNVIEICKDRDSGNQDVFIPLYFDKTCKRLCNYRGENKYYKWEETK